MIDRVLVDTSFVIAMLNTRDKYHPQALRIEKRVYQARQIITQPTLIEVADGLAASHRELALIFMDQCYASPHITIVDLNNTLFNEAINLYRCRPDKAWGLTDCISFAVMQRENITLAATADQHFVQAGFRALMLE